jgi:RNA polymerase sigma-70 factor (ECF subfamily)
MSLLNFVGMIARRRAAAILRSGRQSAWAERPTPDAPSVAPFESHDAAETRQIHREEVRQIWWYFATELSVRQLAMLRALVLDERSIDEVSTTFDVSPNAIYTFRSRMKRRARDFCCELHALPGHSRQAKTPGARRRLQEVAASRTRPLRGRAGNALL